MRIFSNLHLQLQLQSASCKIYLTGFIEVIEVLAVFKTNLYLAPFDESLSNLIIYINWILLFIYYESAWNYMTQLDHFSSELFKIYLIGEEKAIHSISLKTLIPSFSQEKAWMPNILTKIVIF